MSETANWAYTGKATFWKRLEGQNDYGDPLGYAAPVVIDCGYEGGLSKRLGSLGAERVVKNTFWSEFAGADTGDYIAIALSADLDQLAAGGDEVLLAVRFEGTFALLVVGWAFNHAACI